MKKNGDKIILIALYMAELLIAAFGMEPILWMKQKQYGKFRVKDFGEVCSFLGLEVTRNKSEGQLYLKQKC